MILRLLALVGLAACAGSSAPVPEGAVPVPASASPPAMLPAVAALPIIGELSGPTPVVLRGHVEPARALVLLDQARSVHADVTRRFLAKSDRVSPPVQVCVFEDASYFAFVREVFGAGPHSPLGFYRADARVVVVNLARGVGNLRHELVHPLLGDDFPGIPAWLNEGLGALYGSARVERTRVTFLVNYRLRDLQRSIRQGTLPDLAGLTGSTSREVHGEQAAVYYAMSRYLLLYLERRGRLEAVYRGAREVGGERQAVLALVTEAVDYDAFVEWARRLRRRQAPSTP